jgi:hypothetical protein
MRFDRRLTTLTAFVGFAVLSQISFSSIGAAQTARVEVHPIKTMTLTDQQFLNGAKDGPEASSEANCGFRGLAMSAFR